jgi:hypothetical protein
MSCAKSLGFGHLNPRQSFVAPPCRPVMARKLEMHIILLIVETESVRTPSARKPNESRRCVVREPRYFPPVCAAWRGMCTPQHDVELHRSCSPVSQSVLVLSTSMHRSLLSAALACAHVFVYMLLNPRSDAPSDTKLHLLSFMH